MISLNSLLYFVEKYFIIGRQSFVSTRRIFMKHFKVGIDIGSTTIKLVVLDLDERLVFSEYKRHLSSIQETLIELIETAKEKLGNIRFNAMITGSGGLSISNWIGMPFIQEVVSVSNVIDIIAPKTDVAIEIGGEDAKIIYFTNGIEQRMNGICAGGTGAFIDQMATLTDRRKRS